MLSKEKLIELSSRLMEPGWFLKKRLEALKKFNELEKNPELGKPLTANLAGLWSLRFGDYRAIYQIKQSELIILVLKLGHRKNIYD